MTGEMVCLRIVASGFQLESQVWSSPGFCDVQGEEGDVLPARRGGTDAKRPGWWPPVPAAGTGLQQGMGSQEQRALAQIQTA